MEINLVAILLTVVFNLVKRLSTRACQFFQSRGGHDVQADVDALRASLTALKRERDQYNPMDQFALYARVDRRVNKVAQEIAAKQGEVRARRLKLSLYINGFFRAVDAVYSLVLIWYYRYTPIFDFGVYPASDYGPDAHIIGDIYHITEHDLSSSSSAGAGEWSLFSPISYFLSFPSTNRCNSIGITFWLFILNRTINIVIAKLTPVAETALTGAKLAETAAINSDIELD